MAVSELETPARRPTLAVWKLASCDGCQLSLLNCEDELLAIVGGVDIAHFAEATSADKAGPYDLSLVEGSVTTPEDAERIHEIRRISRKLVTIGACATSGGIQALRNGADIGELVGAVYATPAYISTLATSTPIADHVDVDFELHGCPIDRLQLLEVLTAFLQDRAPRIPAETVCVECKRRGNVCVMVAHGTPCLGPVTHSGCGALCPSYSRGCYGCFGPIAGGNTASLTAKFAESGVAAPDVARLFRTFTVGAEPFRLAAAAAEATDRTDTAAPSTTPGGQAT